MAIYCYTDGKKTIDLSFPIGTAPKSLVREGRRFVRDFSSERPGVPSTVGWPMECVASGVHASQADELRKFYVEHGCPTEVTADGNPIYRSAAHRRKALKLRGFRDKASYI